MGLTPLATRQLTAREREVLSLLATDLDNKHIADHLGVSPHTLQHHLTALYAKLGCPDRARAIVRGLHAGLIRSDEPPIHRRQSTLEVGVQSAQERNVVVLWVGDSLTQAWHAVSPKHFEHGRAECGAVLDRCNGSPEMWQRTCSACERAIAPATAMPETLALLSAHWRSAYGLPDGDVVTDKHRDKRRSRQISVVR
jgi:DNA-binding CsgD family transcriptional regulator